MVNREDIKVFNSLIKRVQNILNELDNFPYAKEDNLQSLLDKFKLHKQLIAQLHKLTNKGNFTALLRKRVEKIKTWLNNIENDLDKERVSKKNKNTLLDISQVEKYKEYCDKAAYFFEEVFPQHYQNIISNSSTISEKYNLINKNLKYFDLPEDIVNADLLRAEDGEFGKMDLAEPKTLSNIKPIISNLASTIKKSVSLISSIQNVEKELSELDVKQLFGFLNTRNKLFDSLLRNMVQINKVIYQGEFYNNIQIREAYQILLDKILTDYPILGKTLGNLSLKKQDPIQEEIMSSMKGIREQLEDDKVDTFVSPHYNKPISDDEIKQVSPPPLPQKKPSVVSSNISPEDKAKYESLWREGDPLSKKEKEKYEQLWNESSTKMEKLLTKLSYKYEL